MCRARGARDVECGWSGLVSRPGGGGRERHGRRLDLQERLVKVEVLVKNIHVHAGAVHVGGHGQAVREVDIGMGGSGRGGILGWTGSVGSRSSSSMARVGGEHLGEGEGVGAGVGILDCLIGHATTAAAAGAFPDSSTVRSPAEEWRCRSRGCSGLRRSPLAACRLWLLACCCRCPRLPGIVPEVSVGEGGGEGWEVQKGQRLERGCRLARVFAGLGERESRPVASRPRFRTRPPRLHTGACGARLNKLQSPQSVWGRGAWAAAPAGATGHWSGGVGPGKGQ